MLTPPTTKQRLIHVHSNPDEIGRVFVADRGVCCDPKAFLKTALDLVQEPLALPPSAERASYEAWQTPFATPGDVKMEQVITHLSAVMPENAIVTNGAGNYAAWLHRYYRYKSYRTQLAPTSGSMGYGLPAAVAAKLERPEQEVVCLAGDGCFQMCMQEFGTAVQYGANIIVIVSNNGVYGTIRMHQQRHYPNRPAGTDMINPDFAALAAAYGAHGERVMTSAEFPAALERARASGKPAIIELKTDPDAVSHRTPA